MLVNVLIDDFNPMAQICNMIAMSNGNSTEIKNIEKGIYEIGHFSFGNIIQKKEEYPELSINCYGVCDNHKQILEQCPELINNKNNYVISITPIEKKNQSSDGGWRWHKWGPYIGNGEITAEYLYDEPKIEKIYVYHIYEV
jgi:hypothetical protein